MLETWEVIKALEELTKPLNLIEAFEEANEVSARYIILRFKSMNSKYVEGINIILRYLPHTSLVIWGRIEVLVSRDIPAKEFLTRIYNELIKSKAEVLVKADGISVFYKLNTASANEFKADLIRKISECLRIIEGTRDVNLVYEGFKVLNHE